MAKHVKSEFVRSLLEMSKVFDVSERTCERWARELGAPKRTQRGWSVTAWKQWREERDGPVLTANGSAPGGNARDRKEEAEARIKELKVLQLERRLVYLDSVIRVMSKYITDARNILQTIPHRVSIVVPEGGDRSLVRSEAETTVSDVLSQLEQCGKEIESMTNEQ